MQEAFIHLPVADNDGKDLGPHMDHVLGLILDAFGGYTVVDAQGAWKDPKTGKVYREPVKRVAVAANWDAYGVRAVLHDIAVKACRYMRQECIYLALPDGVEFVGPEVSTGANIAAE